MIASALGHLCNVVNPYWISSCGNIKKFQKIFFKGSLQVQYLWQKDTTNFHHCKITLKIKILRCSRRLFIIFESLTVTLFSEKKLISAWCICGFISNWNKKSLTVSNLRGGEKKWLLRPWVYCSLRVVVL